MEADTMDFAQLESSVWQRLAEERRPIVLYGMGDGADKILTQFERFGIKISAVFASDEFVRGHSFHGFPVQRLCEVQEKFGEDIVIVISFASQRPDVLERMYALDAKFDVVAPDVPVAGEDLFDEAFVRQHAEQMKRAYALLADEQSRRVFLDTVRFKLSGRLCYLRQSETTKDEIFNAVLRPSQQEHFADLGAYNGDTIRELLSYTEKAFASVTALEPDRRNFRKLSRYAEEMLSGEVRLIQAGAWDCDTEQCFAAKAGRQSRIAERGIMVPMRSLDSVLHGAPCTMLKMDVEGAEREALQGAANTIRRFHPKLNIAAYHRSEDFFALPLLVHSLQSDYRIYLRHHPYVPAWDTNLYAI
ncbi:MAG: FkbM family methyltransferase [Agathobaculum sp.]|jgi:FkbM family methyltransferase|uniref:FkbM family methyltransferase n=1 Tax=Agathobaculum sp. TaxID=2048138 RepID=UPI003D93A6F6